MCLHPARLQKPELHPSHSQRLLHEPEVIRNAVMRTILPTGAATLTKTLQMACPVSLRTHMHCHGHPCQHWRLPWRSTVSLALSWLACTRGVHLTFGNGEPSRQQHQEEDPSTQGVGDNHIPAAGSNQTEDGDRPIVHQEGKEEEDEEPACSSQACHLQCRRGSKP